jgi:predicted transglutaminase-like cysteine proteinase
MKAAYRAAAIVMTALLFSGSAALAGNAPRAAAALPGTTSATGVFQSVAFPVSSFPAARNNWEAVRRFVETSDFLACDGRSDCAAGGDLQKAIGSVLSADFRRKLDVINRTVNRLVRYLPDDRNYGSMDVWAAPAETLLRGTGDCEDYAILKMAALKQAGVPLQDMSVVVVRDTRRNLYHAVLSVKNADGYFILDNMRADALSDRDLRDYVPLYSVGVAGYWIHGHLVSRDGAGAS